jgi:PAS domain S-box-containing protein
MALEESERKFRAIFNQTFQLSGLLSPDGTVLEINQTAIDFLGFDYEDGLGRLLWELPWRIPNPEILKKFKAAITEAAGGRFVRLEGSVIDRGGKELTLDYSLKPVFDEKGRVIWLIAEGRDISERKVMEQALVESEKQLRRLSLQVLAAQEMERKRVSKELHDGIGQYLSAVKFKVEDALHRQSLGKEPENDLGRLKTIIPVLQGAIEEVRRICVDLRPSILDDLGILATISWFCREFQKTFGAIRIIKHIKVEEKEIPAALRTTIYRIIQEAFNNISKHSRAGRIDISLTRAEGFINLVIRDNGQGFELKDRASEGPAMKGLGLASMKERAEFSGGQLTIQSVKGAGTTIRAVWPEEP